MGNNSATNFDEDDDNTTTFSVQGRVNTIKEASQKEEVPSQIILAVERRSPRTLVRSEWEMRFSNDRNPHGMRVAFLSSA